MYLGKSGRGSGVFLRSQHLGKSGHLESEIHARHLGMQSEKICDLRFS